MKKTIFVFLLVILALVASCTKHEIVYPFNGQDTSYFHDWLLCGPFPNCPECDRMDYMHDEKCAGFFTDYLQSIGGEAAAQPTDGMTVKTDSIERTWFFYHSDTDKIPFNSIFEPNDMVVAYAFCQVNSPIEQRAILSVGSNDGVKVFFTGERYTRAIRRTAAGCKRITTMCRSLLKKG